MKKLLSLLCVLGLGITLPAQNIVTTIPQFKSAVLEEYTGIHCTFCPDGHKLAKELKGDYPGRVVLVNIHEGSYAVPSGSEPDFRTQWGTALRQQTGLTGYPAGTMNRHVFSSLNSQTALNRGVWRTAAEEIMQDVSPINLGASTSYDASTRTITINVEALYTANATNSYNLLNIALIQDSIPGPQTGGANYNPGDIVNGQYIHGHMLRDLITGQWGDTLSNTTNGSLFSKTYTYVIPNNVNGVVINPDHCHLAIYTTSTRQDITQGISLGINGDMNDGNNAPYYGGFSNLSDMVLEGPAATPTSFTTDLNLTANGTYEFELLSDAPSDWSASYKIDGTSYTGVNNITLSSANTINAEIIVTAGNTAALGQFTLVAKPVGVSNVEIQENVYLISGITDLIINSTGDFGNGQSYNWQPNYEDGLDAAGNTKYDATDANVMRAGIDGGAFNNVANLYFNVAWKFPSMTDDQATSLMTFLDNGGNLFIAGQDLGWAMNTSRTQGGYQTATKTNFYNNYLQASFSADGGTANSQLTAIGSDNIFGSIGSSAIIDPYGNNFYPDEFSANSAVANAIFNYNGNASKVSGLRADNGTYKIVYLGIGIEMIQDASVGDAIIKTSHDWFNGMISVEEFDRTMARIFTYPNPVEDKITVELKENGSYTLTVTDLKGSIVLSNTVTVTDKIITLDLSLLPKGSYNLSLKSEEQAYIQKLIKN